MNPAQLLAHFDRISEAPDAIPRLRRFVLDLAVRGKLVEQDPRDEPASELLKRIDAEKALLVKQGKIRKQELLQDLDESDIPFELPAGWLWSRLGNIGDWGSGSTPPRGNSEYYGGETTWLKSGELGDCLALKGSEERVTEVALQKCSFRLNQPGDVLIAMYGATIGKLAILAEPAVTNQAVCGCTPFAGILNRYLFTYLLSRRADFHAQSEGGAQPNISKVKIVLSAFALPPLAEQHRIVAKVDELMALCDRLEAAQAERESQRDRLVASSLHRLNNGADADAFRDNACFYFKELPRFTTRLKHIQQLRQTILNLAVRGKLVPQDPRDEPVAQLLEQIRSEINQSFNPKKQVFGESAANRSIELPYEIPIQWSWIRLGDLLPDFQNGVSSRGDAQGTPTIVLRLADIKNGAVSLAATRQMLLPDNATSKYKLENGDTLIVRVNGSAEIVGRFVVCREKISAIYCDHFIRMRVRSSWVSPKFIGILGDSPLIREQIGSLFITTAGQKTVNQGHISALLSPLPPLAEQHRIVAKVEELLALCDELEAQLTTAQTESRRFLEATLHDALAPASESQRASVIPRL